MQKIEKFQIAVGLVISVATVAISWQTYRLTGKTETNNAHLKAIEQQLAETRFGFERIRDVYDRTEKYLASPEQNESRGRVLVVLINSLPDSGLRSELLSVVSVDAKSNAVAAKAADLKAGTELTQPSSTPIPGFTGDRSFRLDAEKYQVTTNGEFSFTDSKGITWSVPKGYVTDGSSIPRAFWATLGSPLSSEYVIPVLLHGYHTESKTRSWQEVDMMFYEALRKAGVNDSKAKLMYYAVYQFGPRW